MIIVRSKYFSTSAMDRIVNKLEAGGIDDFEVSKVIPRDCISLTTNPKNLQVYFPVEFEYFQYEVDDFIRSMVPFLRTTTMLDRNIYIMKLHGQLTETQYIKLVRFIIEEEDYCVLVTDDNK